MKVRYAGFTLIELLVVLTVIALLLSIVAPNYIHHVDHAREVALRQDLVTIRDSIDKYHVDHARYPKDLNELVTSHYLRNLPEDPITERIDSWVITPASEGGMRDISSGATTVSSEGTPYAAW